MTLVKSADGAWIPVADEADIKPSMKSVENTASAPGLESPWPQLPNTPILPGEVRITDPETGGQKGRKLERWDLLPFEALDEVARVYAYGAGKYDDHNWRKGMRWSLLAGAMLRHISLWMQGEDRDKESGLHHLAHACFHCLSLLTYAFLGLGTDDRAPRP